MLRAILNGILSTTNTLLINTETPAIDRPSTSRWRTFGNFLYSTLSTFGIPLLRLVTGGDTVYECVNSLLVNSSPTRNHTDQRQRTNSNLNRLSRPNFRRRSHHHGGNVRILKPTIHIHLHQT